MCYIVDTAAVEQSAKHPIGQLREVDAMCDGVSPQNPCWGKA